MTVRLSELRATLHAFAASFDASCLSPHDLRCVLADAAAIENMAATVKALAAARVAETSMWKRAGDRSPAHHLARTTGMSVTAAAVSIEAAQRLGSLPVAADAARHGELSAPQLAAVTSAAIAAPAAEQSLVSLARRTSLRELRDECAKTRCNAHPDPEARRRAIHSERCLRTYTDGDGAGHLHLRDNPERIALVMSTVGVIRDELFESARLDGRRESLDAYAADALFELARRYDQHTSEVASTVDPTPGRRRRKRGAARSKLLVRVDLPTLLRGYPIEGETCEIVGYGPLAVSAVRDMIDSGDPFLTAVATSGKQVQGVAHLGRRHTAHQQTALEWLNPTCAREGCNALAYLENDHRIDWSQSHVTLVDWSDRLCGHDHDLKTRQGWSLVEGTGKRAFVPPDDPRHPTNARAHAPPDDP